MIIEELKELGSFKDHLHSLFRNKTMLRKLPFSWLLVKCDSSLDQQREIQHNLSTHFSGQNTIKSSTQNSRDLANLNNLVLVFIVTVYWAVTVHIILHSQDIKELLWVSMPKQPLFLCILLFSALGMESWSRSLCMWQSRTLWGMEEPWQVR